jgi:hypothetical protein
LPGTAALSFPSSTLNPLHAVGPALDALQKAGVQTLGGGTMSGSDPFGIMMIVDADLEKALAVLKRAAISARSG